MTTELTRRSLFSPSEPAPKTPKLEFRMLGNTGMKVTSVAFGCMITSDPSVIERAIDLGVNYFDTARVYQGGNNERMVGAALRGHRDQVYLSTKSVARDKAGLLAHLDTSLKELGTDHVDIWYLHSYQKPEDIKDELLEAQEIAETAGQDPLQGHQQPHQPGRRHARRAREEALRRFPGLLQLRDGPGARPRTRRSEAGRCRHRGHEGHGRRLSRDAVLSHDAGLARADAEGWRHPRRPQVGAQE